MNTISIEQFKGMWHRALQELCANAEEFSRLDAVIGDGDHGEAIVTAMTEVDKACQEGKDFKNMINAMGFNVMLNTSGSTSTLLGGFLLGMSDAAPATDQINAQQLRAIFQSGLQSVQKNTRAQVGDKTMMDALIPAVEAIQSHPDDDILGIMQAAADNATKGAESTIDMQANFGRARNFGEKSIGSMDSGAASWSCMFRAFSLALNTK